MLHPGAQRQGVGWNTWLNLRPLGRRNLEVFADFPRQVVIDFAVARNGAFTIATRIVATKNDARLL